MASIEVRYNCGCGFHTSSLEAAVEHSDDTYHSVTVSGVIKPDTPKPAKLTQVAARRAQKRVLPLVEAEPVFDSGGFEAMKQKLGRR